MKKFSFFIATVLLITVACNKIDDSKEISNQKSKFTESNYSVNGEPFRKLNAAKTGCINIVENCSPKDVIVRPHFNDNLASAIANNELADFFSEQENCDTILPDDSFGANLASGLQQGLLGVFIYTNNDKVLYFIGDIADVSENNFDYVVPVTIEEE